MTSARVLVVEDENIVAKDIGARLENLGYAVAGIAANGEDAVFKASQLKPDIVLMDIMLKGGTSGISAADTIRRMFDIPVIYLTAYADEDTLQKAKITEPFGYIIKPFEDRELHTTIEIALYKYSMERRLRESWQWFFVILNSIVDAVIAVDNDGRVKFINHAGEVLTGRSQKDIIGKPLENVCRIVEEENGSAPENPVAAVVKAGALRDVYRQAVLETGSGRRIPVDGNATSLRDEKGGLDGAVLVLRDITRDRQMDRDRDKLHAQLVQSEKMAGVGTLANGVAHEFNNILQIINGYVQCAILSDSQEEIRESLGIISDMSAKATKIVRNLLSFSRMGVPVKEICNIRELIESLLSITEGPLKTQNVGVQCRYEGTPMVEANKAELQQVFLNIVINARDAMLPRGGELSIGVRQDGDTAEIVFSDNGKGIRREDQSRLFEPFFTTKGALGGSTVQGTGLGLYVSYGIVKKLGGAIAIDSEENRGTTVTVRLPVKEEA